jgi:hypothetical protein
MALGACERVTAPEADAAAQTLERIATSDPWASSPEYYQARDAATGILRRLDGVASRIVVERDGRSETYKAVVFAYESGALHSVASDSKDSRRTLVAWQSPGVRNLILMSVGSRPDPFQPIWLGDDTTYEALEALHDRMMVSPGKRALLFDASYHVAMGGVATISPAMTVDRRCAEALRSEDLLDGYSATLSAVSCQAASFEIAFELELHAPTRSDSIQALRFGGFDRRAWSRRPTRLAAPPQVVLGVRFDLGCERYAAGSADPRCPRGTLSPTMTP